MDHKTWIKITSSMLEQKERPIRIAHLFEHLQLFRSRPENIRYRFARNRIDSLHPVPLLHWTIPNENYNKQKPYLKPTCYSSWAFRHPGYLYPPRYNEMRWGRDPGLCAPASQRVCLFEASKLLLTLWHNNCRFITRCLSQKDMTNVILRQLIDIDVLSSNW